MSVTTPSRSALSAALNKSNVGGFSSAEQNMLHQLSGEDRARMQQQMILARQQETMGSVLKSLKGMMNAIKHHPRSANTFNAASVGSGARNSGIVPAGAMTSPSRSAATDPSLYSTGVSKQQQDMLDAITDPEEKKKMAAQIAMQNEQEQVAFISNMLKKRNEIAMSIIGNLK